MLEQVSAIDPDEFLWTSPETLADDMVHEYHVEVPQLQYDHITVDQQEAKIDVSGYRGHDVRDRRRPFYRSGTGS